jgi:hypothetical protein
MEKTVVISSTAAPPITKPITILAITYEYPSNLAWYSPIANMLNSIMTQKTNALGMTSSIPPPTLQKFPWPQSVITKYTEKINTRASPKPRIRNGKLK